MTREEAFKDINETQDDYIAQLIDYMNAPATQAFKVINFTSPTGTGKTKMMAKLINQFPNRYFIVTSLSKGQLCKQILNSLNKDCPNRNYDVYGTMEYTINSRLQADEILGRIKPNTECIWLRDEGHIKTNRYDELLADKCFKVINFSATNEHTDIQCNFAHTMMLRTVNQQTGTPEDAIKKLLEIKEMHRAVKNYNPCAIFRCIKGSTIIYNSIIALCEKYHLKYIDLSEDTVQISALCEDNNEYDVIINKFKLIEGIDVRRAHVLYMDSQPKNDITSIQAIGRCRRNALLYRDDIDILATENKELLANTRECYVYFNVKDMRINTDVDGELCYAFCPYISCESLKLGATIEVDNGQLSNGLYVKELSGESGIFTIEKDENTGFNIVKPLTEFYKQRVRNPEMYLFVELKDREDKTLGYKKILINNILKVTHAINDTQYIQIQNAQWRLNSYQINDNVFVLDIFKHNMDLLTRDAFTTKIQIFKVNDFLTSIHMPEIDIESYIDENHEVYMKLCKNGLDIDNYKYTIHEATSNIINIFDTSSIEFLKYCSIKLYRKLYGQYGNGDKWIYNNIKWYIDKSIMNVICLKNQITCSNDIKKIIFYSFEHCYEFPLVNREDIMQLFAPYERTYPKIIVESRYGATITVTLRDVEKYYDDLNNRLKQIKAFDINDNLENLYLSIKEHLQETYNRLKNRIIDKVCIDCTPLYENITNDEKKKIENDEIKLESMITNKNLKHLARHCYHLTVNDKESAIVGLDLFRPFKNRNTNQMTWVESSAVTSKIDKYTKLNRFITQKYEMELLDVQPLLFSGKNSFPLDSRCNSMLGYCVEFYSKYLRSPA